MVLPKWIVAGSLCILAGAAASPASAQRRARTLTDLVNRPSLRGPSTQIGGEYTRGDQAPLSTTRAEPSLMAAPQFTFRGREREGKYSGAMSPALGLYPTSTRSFFTGATNREPWATVGLSEPRDLELPLPNVPIGYVPALTASWYTPQPPTTPFQQLSGLRPPPPKDPPALIPSAPDRLNARTDERLARIRQEALALFRAATKATRERCEDCDVNLSKAVQRLRQVRDLDRSDALAVLLMMHGSLEQERPTRASQELLQAFRRRPQTLFAEARDLDRYFGDVPPDAEPPVYSAYLNEQMRRYSRIGTLNKTSAEAFALQAYCAWRLNEPTETRAALAELERLARDAPAAAEELLWFAAALGEAVARPTGATQ